MRFQGDHSEDHGVFHAHRRRSGSSLRFCLQLCCPKDLIAVSAAVGACERCDQHQPLQALAELAVAGSCG